MPIERIPVWKEMQNWHERQRAMRDFMEANAALTDSITSAGSTQAEGLATLVANATVKRLQKEAAEKTSKLDAANAESIAREQELEKIKARMADYVKLGTPTAVDVKV
jgi:hypothetical protein